MADQETQWLLAVKAAADKLDEALHRYAAARESRSAEAQRLWLDLLAASDDYGTAVTGSAKAYSANREGE